MTTAKSKSSASAVPPAAAVASAAIPVTEAIGAAQADAVKTIGDAVTVSKEAIDTVVKVSADAAAKGYDQARDLGLDQAAVAAKAQDAAYKSYQDALVLSRDTFDVLIRASTILTEGFHEIGQSLIVLTRDTIESNMAASTALLEARTFQDLINVQADLTRTGLDRLIGDGTRLSEEAARLIERSVTPLSEHVSATIDRALRAA